MRELPSGAFMYVPVSQYGRIANQTANLVTNFYSLGEMRRETFAQYLQSGLFAESTKVFLVNRVESAPWSNIRVCQVNPSRPSMSNASFSASTPPSTPRDKSSRLEPTIDPASPAESTPDERHTLW